MKITKKDHHSYPSVRVKDAKVKGEYYKDGSGEFSLTIKDDLGDKSTFYREHGKLDDHIKDLNSQVKIMEENAKKMKAAAKVLTALKKSKEYKNLK